MLAPAETPGKTFLKKVIYKVLCCNNYLCALSLKSVVRKRKIDIIHTNSSVINTGGILSRMTIIGIMLECRQITAVEIISPKSFSQALLYTVFGEKR